MLRVPTYLNEEAKAYWRRHIRACQDNGSLNDQTADSFALTCRIWALLQNIDPDTDSKQAMKFNGLLKQYIVLAKPFGLLGSKPPTASQVSISEVLRNAKQSKKGNSEDDD